MEEMSRSEAAQKQCTTREETSPEENWKHTKQFEEGGEERNKFPSTQVQKIKKTTETTEVGGQHCGQGEDRENKNGPFSLFQDIAESLRHDIGKGDYVTNCAFLKF